MFVQYFLGLSCYAALPARVGCFALDLLLLPQLLLLYMPCLDGPAHVSCHNGRYWPCPFHWIAAHSLCTAFSKVNLCAQSKVRKHRMLCFNYKVSLLFHAHQNINTVCTWSSGCGDCRCSTMRGIDLSQLLCRMYTCYMTDHSRMCVSPLTSGSQRLVGPNPA